MRVCLLMPCGHLLGRGWPLGSCLICLIVNLSLSHWYPGSGVVLNCIDSDLCPLSYFINGYTIACQDIRGLSAVHVDKPWYN